MTRLERIIKGFNEYDKLCSTYIDDTDETISRKQLCELRNEVSLLIENKSHMPSSQAINLLFHIANNISLITDVEEEQEVYVQAIEKAVEALTKNKENE